MAPPIPLGSGVRARKSKPEAKERLGLGSAHQVVKRQVSLPLGFQINDTVNVEKVSQNNDTHISPVISHRKSRLEATPAKKTLSSVRAVATPTKNTFHPRARTADPKTPHGDKAPRVQQEPRFQVRPEVRGSASFPSKSTAKAEAANITSVPRARNWSESTQASKSGCDHSSQTSSRSSSLGEDALAKYDVQSPRDALAKYDVQSPSSATLTEAVTPRVTEELRIAMANVTSMVTERIDLEEDVFDPSHPSLRSQLLERLGFAETAVIRKLEGDQGAFNEGVWMMSDTNAMGVVLKLVPHQRVHPWKATDAEKYSNVQKWCPNIVKEYAFSFPLKILELQSSDGMCKDLVVMRRAQGVQLTHHMFHKFHSGSLSTLSNIFKEFGVFLSTIHRVYKGAQHGDCQPSNIFYDESSGMFTLIDVADFGFGPYMAEGGENDVEHFVDGLKSLAQWYGDDVIADCERHLRAGYDEEKGKHSCLT